MRLFRNEEAARKAGARQTCISNDAWWAVPVGEAGFIAAQVLTDQERRLLEALEDMISVAQALRDANGKIMLDPYTTEAAEALIRELAVEG